MARYQSRFSPFSIILLGILCAVIGYQVRGERPVVKAPPSAIATVDLNRVMNGLAQWDAALEQLEQMQTKSAAEETSREESITADIERLRAMEEGPERRQFEEQVALAQLDLEALRAFNLQLLDTEASLRLENFYRTVKAALGQLAEAEGYDAIYVDDSSGRLRREPPSGVSKQAHIRQQIVNRRLLFVNTSIDITDELIARMNNAFNAGG